MQEIDAKFFSVLVDQFDKFAPLRGIVATFDSEDIEGIVVDHFTGRAKCGEFQFSELEFVEILQVAPTIENVEILSMVDRMIGELITVPVCLLKNIETFDI